MSAPQTPKTCQDVAPLLVFFACGEVTDREHVAIEEHVRLCADCQAQLSEEKNFQSLLGSTMQSADELDASGTLLAQCRSELAERLDDIATPQTTQKTPMFGRLRWWMALHPAWSSALLLLFGLVGGIQFTQWFTGRNNARAVGEAMNVRPGPRFTEDQLSKIVVAGVNLTPTAKTGSQNVRLQLSAEQPMELNGSLDDTDVRDVLTYVVKNGEHSDPGVRLDCLEALKARAGDMAVRSALLSAARKDANPAVRLKALDALRGFSSDREVREVLLESLRHDSNPGVRVEAVNILVNSIDAENPAMLAPVGDSSNPSNKAASNDESLDKVIRALAELEKTDTSRYVRLRSAAALRQIEERNEQ
jgi:HEAT repeats